MRTVLTRHMSQSLHIRLIDVDNSSTDLQSLHDELLIKGGCNVCFSLHLIILTAYYYTL